MAIPYYHIDAFTDELFRGNPAGVCILAAFPADRTMQKIAAENRHSETAFVLPRTDRDFDLRWFTPTVEIDLCGHATLASAYALALRGHAAWPVRFHTRSGVLTVAQSVAQTDARDGAQSAMEDGGSFELDFPARPPQPCKTPEGLLPAMGLQAALVMKSPHSSDYLVVVEREQQVRALTPDLPALAQLLNGGVAVTASGEGNVDYVCRLFAPSQGIDEDPATGSIHCILAPYWAGRLGKTSLRAQQLSTRGGSMQSTIDGDRVKITGKARLYLRGTLEL